MLKKNDTSEKKKKEEDLPYKKLGFLKLVR